MRKPASLASLDLASLARLYRRGETSPTDVMGCVLERISTHPDPAVWIHLLSPEEVLSAGGGGRPTAPRRGSTAALRRPLRGERQH